MTHQQHCWTRSSAACCYSTAQHSTAQLGVLDREHRYVYANRELLQFVGRSADQVLGRSLAEVQGQAAFANYLPLAVRPFQGESLRSEDWMDFPGLGRRYLVETWVPYVTDGGPVQTVACFGQDHTARKQHGYRTHGIQLELALAEGLPVANVDGDQIGQVVMNLLVNAQQALAGVDARTG